MNNHYREVIDPNKTYTPVELQGLAEEIRGQTGVSRISSRRPVKGSRLIEDLDDLSKKLP